MKTLDSNLLAAQKSANGRGIAQVGIYDNDRLQPSLFTTDTPSGNNTVGIITSNANAIVRLRNTVGNILDVQRITAPNTASQWSSWSNLVASNVYTAIAIFNTGIGGYLVAVWQDSSTKQIKYKRSSDEGQTWSATATAYAALPTFCDMAGVSGGSSHSGIFLTYNSQLYWAAYTPGTDTWSAVNSAGITMTSLSCSVAGAWDSTNSRWIVAFTPSGYVTWATSPVVILTRSSGGTWSAGRVFYGIGGGTTGQAHVALSQTSLNGLWCLTFSRVKDWGTEKYWLAYSNDGVYWQDVIALDVVGDGTFHIYGALSSAIWMGTERKVFKSTYEEWGEPTVVSYQYDSASHKLELVADNRSVSFSSANRPPLFAFLHLYRGLEINGGATKTERFPIFYITHYRFQQADQLIQFTATDALGLLSIWRADQSFRFDNEQIKTLVELVCALAGVHTVTFDSNAIWTDTIPIFVINPNASGMTALNALLRRTGALPVILDGDETPELYFFIPSQGVSSVYTYGTSPSHIVWPSESEFGPELSPTYVSTFGVFDTDAIQQIADEASDYASQAQAGFRITEVVNERTITVTADVEQLVDIQEAVILESQHAGIVLAPPNFGLELNDVVAFDYPAYAASIGWRIVRYVEAFNASGPHKFYQRLFIRGDTG